MDKQMKLKELMNTFQKAELKKLAESETPSALQKQAETLGHSLSQAESELVFAALSPLCGQESVEDEYLEMVAGGELPDPPKPIWTSDKFIL